MTSRIINTINVLVCKKISVSAYASRPNVEDGSLRTNTPSISKVGNLNIANKCLSKAFFSKKRSSVS